MDLIGDNGNLGDRLNLISQMLEEAVVLLRTTMSEVREEAKGDQDDDGDERRTPRSDRRPS
jgi:hypothetical protein